LGSKSFIRAVAENKHFLRKKITVNNKKITAPVGADNLYFVLLVLPDNKNKKGNY
jgi:hypothetical protein